MEKNILNSCHVVQGKGKGKGKGKGGKGRPKPSEIVTVGAEARQGDSFKWKGD